MSSLGESVIEERKNREMSLRVNKYSVIDYLNSIHNKMLVFCPASPDRDDMFMDLKRAKELVNNL